MITPKEEFIKLREMEAAMQGVSLCNENWEFFYDETGNCRKFRLKEDGTFNSPEALSHYFILGGLVFDSKSDAQNSNPQALIQSLHLGTNFTELKSNMLCPSDWTFENFIKHDRVSKVIQWIDCSKANIHYSIENNLYFALVDIIDSIQDVEIMAEFNFSLKDALYRAAKKHLDTFSEFLSRHGYPDITQTKNFWDELTEILLDISVNDSDFSNDSCFTILTSMVKNNSRHPDKQNNTLLENNEKGELQDSYFPSYLRCCSTFLYAHLNFDEEKKIIPHLSSCDLTNYDFIDSKNEPLIQISDCFISILSKTLLFFDSKSTAEIQQYSRTMDSVSKENFKRLYNLILKAEAKHIFLIHNTNAISVLEDHRKKWELVIR